MNSKKNILIVSGELSIQERQVEAVASLLSEDATVPFIARYRKEMTGSLDEVQVIAIRDRLETLAELDARREAILSSLTEQGKLTPELEKAVHDAETLSKLEDIYLPYRPKRKTRGSVAKEKGLEPLAQKIFEQSAFDIAKEAALFLDAEKGVADIEEALAGARKDGRLEDADQLLEILGGQLGVDPDAAVLLHLVQGRLEEVWLVLVLGLAAHHDVAIHGHEAPVAVVGEARVVRLGDDALHGGVAGNALHIALKPGDAGLEGEWPGMQIGCEFQRHDQDYLVGIDISGQVLVGEFLRDRPLGGARGDAWRELPFDLGGHAGRPWVLPVGVPAGVHAKLHACEDDVARPRRHGGQDQPRLRIHGLLETREGRFDSLDGSRLSYSVSASRVD